jgi:hypothetical protein
MMTNAFPTTRTPFGALPIDEIIARMHASASQLNAAAAKMQLEPDDFGDEIVRATKARLAARHGRVIRAEDEPQSDFGEQITDAVKRRLGNRKSAQQQRHDDPDDRKRRALLATTIFKP